MLNPLRSEAEAYRFLLLTLAAFGLIVAARELLGGTAAWITSGVIALAVAAAYFRARSTDRPEPREAASRGATDERRILVVANETVAGEALREAIEQRSSEVRERVLVVCPALNSRLRHWASDDDGARAAAQQRLDRSLERLAELGIEARGEVGDSEPLQAMEDALRRFDADEIIISTHPAGRSHWLERGVVRAARERFSVPITHVVVDLGAERPLDAG